MMRLGFGVSLDMPQAFMASKRRNGSMLSSGMGCLAPFNIAFRHPPRDALGPCKIDTARRGFCQYSHTHFVRWASLAQHLPG